MLKVFFRKSRLIDEEGVGYLLLLATLLIPGYLQDDGRETLGMFPCTILVPSIKYPQH